VEHGYEVWSATMDSSESSEDQQFLPSESSTKKSRKFDAKQQATLNAYYNTGMKGIGEANSFRIRCAAADTGLTTSQVKVL